MTRVVFMGSPEFAVPSLRALTRDYAVVGVVTQPDRPAGRGREVRAPEIKREAVTLGLPVVQPNKLTDPLAIEQLTNWAPDLIVVAAFGQILRRAILDLPKHGCINVHASLLPRWRGAAPIQATIAAGDIETGVTIMKMDEGLDTGGIILQRTIAIEPRETGGSLTIKLAELGGEVLPLALRGYLAGELTPRLQDAAAATKAPMLKKEDGLLDFALRAEELERRVRAFNPWPGAYLEWNHLALKVHRAHVMDVQVSPAQRVVLDGKPAVGASKGALVLDEVQPAGRRAMDGIAFLLGARNWAE